MTLKNIVLAGCFIFALDSVASDDSTTSQVMSSRSEVKKEFAGVAYLAFKGFESRKKVELNHVFEDGNNYINIKMNGTVIYHLPMTHSNPEDIKSFNKTINCHFLGNTMTTSRELRRFFDMETDTLLSSDAFEAGSKSLT